MPKLNLNDGLEKQQTAASHYGFSAVSLNKLTGTDQYTLVTIALDKSGSVSGFQDGINNVVASVVEACRKSPRADNLLLRVVEFNHFFNEVHGFKLLTDCNAGDYNSTTMMSAGGTTALYDASLNAIEALVKYGKDLVDQDYSVNGILIIVSDGEDNASSLTPKHVKAELDKVLKGESLESVLSILIGVNVSDSRIKAYLDGFKDDAGFSQYVNLDDASPNKLARLANFVSKSISSQSQSLGGGISKTLTF